jgi:hypothetical protein
MSHCLRESFSVLIRTGLATETELAVTADQVERAVMDGAPLDVIETLVRVQGAAEEHVPAEAGRVAQVMAHAVYPPLPLIPFAAKLITPTSFYENFPQLFSLSKLLMSPIIYAEDTDAVGTAALNPVAAKIMGEEILAVVDQRTGIKPFVSVVRMEHNHWSFLTRKHFSL